MVFLGYLFKKMQEVSINENGLYFQLFKVQYRRNTQLGLSFPTKAIEGTELTTEAEIAYVTSERSILKYKS